MESSYSMLEINMNNKSIGITFFIGTDFIIIYQSRIFF